MTAKSQIVKTNIFSEIVPPFRRSIKALKYKDKVFYYKDKQYNHVVQYTESKNEINN
jgi:hypothetical protein